MQTATLINGFVLGWSVAWPPGPVNAEMLRRTLLSAIPQRRILKNLGLWLAAIGSH